MTSHIVVVILFCRRQLTDKTVAASNWICLLVYFLQPTSAPSQQEWFLFVSLFFVFYNTDKLHKATGVMFPSGVELQLIFSSRLI